MMHRIIILLICLTTAGQLLSQEVKGAEGRWPIVNITPEQARENALEEAKKDALRKAGVPESIKAVRTLSTVEAAGENRDLYSQFASIEMQGAVTNYSIIRDEQLKEPLDGQFYAVVTINATVKKYHSVADPEFKINVQGLRSNGYKDGEKITFSVHPNKEGYLKIFLFETMDTATQVFPNNYERDRRLNAKETLHFPTVDGINYTAEKSTTATQEHNLLLFVYTKADMPFYGATTRERVLSWINNMEPDGREVVIAPLLITE